MTGRRAASASRARLAIARDSRLPPHGLAQRIVRRLPGGCVRLADACVARRVERGPGAAAGLAAAGLALHLAEQRGELELSRP